MPWGTGHKQKKLGEVGPWAGSYWSGACPWSMGHACWQSWGVKLVKQLLSSCLGHFQSKRASKINGELGKKSFFAF